MHLTGAAITEAHWDAFWAFYQDTGARKWGQPYLTRAFFSLLGERMADKLLLVLALRDGAPIAGALNVIGAEALYGRYWGAERSPISISSFAITRRSRRRSRAACTGRGRRAGRAQAGARLPAGADLSAHYIADPSLRQAVADYLAAERRAVGARSTRSRK